MSRYIDAEAFFKVINTLPYKDTSYPDTSAYNGAISDVADMLTHFPAADVQEVRHGRWEYVKKRLARGGYVDASECSVCHKIIMPHLKPNHCPNCGSRMDLNEVTE